MWNRFDYFFIKAEFILSEYSLLLLKFKWLIVSNKACFIQVKCLFVWINHEVMWSVAKANLKFKSSFQFFIFQCCNTLSFPWCNKSFETKEVACVVFALYEIRKKLGGRQQSISPSQTKSQVDASWKPGSTCDSIWPGLACTCVHLRHDLCSLWPRSNLTQVKASFYRSSTQPKSTRVTSINPLLANEIENSLP